MSPTGTERSKQVNGVDYRFAVDSVEFWIERPNKAGGRVTAQFWSPKYRCPMLKYTVVVDVTKGNLFAWAGPNPSVSADVTLWNSSHVCQLVQQLNWHGIGDAGYRGAKNVTAGGATFGNLNADPIDRLLHSVRAIVERWIGRLRFFDILNHQFSYDIAFHGEVFKCCVQLIELYNQVHPL
jgi:hypothetical protein